MGASRALDEGLFTVNPLEMIFVERSVNYDSGPIHGAVGSLSSANSCPGATGTVRGTADGRPSVVNHGLGDV